MRGEARVMAARRELADTWERDKDAKLELLARTIHLSTSTIHPFLQEIETLDKIDGLFNKAFNELNWLEN